MMTLNKVRKLYPLINVIKFMRTMRPLGIRQTIDFYTAILRWIARFGRASFYDVLPAYNVNSLFQEAYEVEHLLPKFINKYTVFIDIGAHIGFYTVFVCNHVRRVLAIEPNPLALVYLKANVNLNKCSNCIIMSKAISDRKGLAKLKIPKTARKPEVSAVSSIVKEYEEATEIIVKTDTLDNIVK